MARTGRPREFDIEVALDAALRLFWQHGYDGTSLAALRAAMDISSTSLYAAFSSKATLFAAVLRRYLADYGQVTDVVTDRTLTSRDAVEQMLRRSAVMQTDPAHPSGCLVGLSSVLSTQSDAEVARLLADRRESVRHDVLARVLEAVEAGQLRAGVAEALATQITATLWGLSTEARDGVSRERLEASVDAVMFEWDALGG